MHYPAPVTRYVQRIVFIVGLAMISLSAHALDILVTNDDGYQAEGIKVLASTLASAGNNVLVVAPKTNQSGVGGKFNTGFGQPTGFTKVGDGRYFVAGSPVDSVLMGLLILGPERGGFGSDGLPDLVVSGINQGGNIGILTNHSGTVGAAVRAIREGVPAIAVSAGLDLSESRSGFPSTSAAYPKVAAFVVDIIDTLEKAASDKKRLLPLGVGLNVNYPVALPKGHDKPLGTRFTRITNSTINNLVPVRDDDGNIVIGIRPIKDLDTQAQSSDNDSKDTPAVTEGAEGELFKQGFITISTMDGLYDAPRIKRELVRVRLDDLAAP